MIAINWKPASIVHFLPNKKGSAFSSFDDSCAGQPNSISTF
jgi:hypothetical protein